METMPDRGLYRFPGIFLFLVIGLSAFSGQIIAVASAYGDTVQAGNGGAIVFENRIETEHFVLHWTNKSLNRRNNIGDPQIVFETATYLEDAWSKLTGAFGRRPYTSSKDGRIKVVFKDIDCYAFADPPEGPITLNSSIWVKLPSVRQSTSAHEVFHKLQYAYGYKTRWVPSEPFLWFTEGTAAWAEVFVCGRVSRNCKMEEMFKNRDLDLYEAEDMALPFWIYFASGNSGIPGSSLMVELFERCEQTGDAKNALLDIIGEVYGPVDRFFLCFATWRKNGFQQDLASKVLPYPCILGPDGRNLVAEIGNYLKERVNPPPQAVDLGGAP